MPLSGACPDHPQISPTFCTTVSLSICNLETGVSLSCLSPPLDHTLCLISGLSGPGAEWDAVKDNVRVVSPSCLALSHTGACPVLRSQLQILAILGPRLKYQWPDRTATVLGKCEEFPEGFGDIPRLPQSVCWII